MKYIVLLLSTCILLTGCGGEKLTSQQKIATKSTLLGGTGGAIVGGLAGYALGGKHGAMAGASLGGIVGGTTGYMIAKIKHLRDLDTAQKREINELYEQLARQEGDQAFAYTQYLNNHKQRVKVTVHKEQNTGNQKIVTHHVTTSLIDDKNNVIESETYKKQVIINN